MSQLFPKLFSPLKLGHLELPNRALMGAMHTGLEELPDDGERLSAFYQARVNGGVGLIVTGGYAPNEAGRLYGDAKPFIDEEHISKHKNVTKAVHEAGGYICLQILHAGRYAVHKDGYAPSAIKSPITPFAPEEITAEQIEQCIDDFVNTAKLAKKAGYDGTEIMGSEGYLINQFLAKRTNQRSDEWGSSYEAAIRFPIEIVKRIRRAVGNEFLIMYRLSMLDLVEEGSDWEEVTKLAKEIETAGADVINTGIGWHESRVPTIASLVPRAAFVDVTAKLKSEINIPIITANRINAPETAEEILKAGKADMVSMARPFLADPEFMNKAQQEKPQNINTCIACNQACLDHLFRFKMVSCLVNPAACFEKEYVYEPASIKKKLAVIGAGPAGLSCAALAAERGHDVSLYDQASEIGGQFNFAKRIPGKQEFYETLRYYSNRLNEAGVEVFLNTNVDASELDKQAYDEVIIATGVHPSIPQIPGIDHPKVVSYDRILSGEIEPGSRVAIIGAGGIGFDMAAYLIGDHEDEFMDVWGVDKSFEVRGGLVPPLDIVSPRQVYLLQRSKTRFGKSLGATTGWIHLLSLKKAGVNMINGVSYESIDDDGLHFSIEGEAQLLELDHIVICAGQTPRNQLYNSIKDSKIVHVIGGAKDSKGLDAKKAILEGTRLGMEL